MSERDQTAKDSAALRERRAWARVLLVGLDLWGAAAAVALAQAGVGALHLLDEERCTNTVRSAIAREAPACLVTTGSIVAAPGRALALDDTRWDLVLAALPGDDLLVLSAVARFAHAAGVPSLGAHLDGLTAVLGPAVVPGETACWECCRLRRLAASERPEVDDAIQEALLRERPPRRSRTYPAPLVGLLGHALALAALGVLDAPEASPLVGRIQVRSLVDRTTSLHVVLPLPSCEVCGGARSRPESASLRERSGVRLDAARDPAELRRLLAGVVDARTGIVKSLVLEPPSPVTYPEAPRTAMATLSAPLHPRCCHGHAGRAEVGSGKGEGAVEAMIGAVGEAVERYAASQVDPARILRAAPAAMGEDHVPPERLALYADHQYARPGFPFARVDPKAPIDWIRGHWLDGGAPVWVPALAAFFDYPAPPEETFCQVTSNGLAAGATAADAALRATLELIERDAFMLSWLARIPARRVHLDASTDLATREIVRQLGERGARVEIYLLAAGAGVPAVVATGFGDGRRWPGATVAMAAHPSPRRAARKAVLELGHVGPYLHQRMIAGDKPVPETPEQVVTLDDHARYYFPPSRSGALAFLGQGGSVSLGDLEEPADASSAWLAGRLRAAGLRVAIVDLTSPDLERTPFRVARAVGPDLQPIHFGHAVARLGSPRLLALAPGGPNPDPHPMA